MRLADGRHEAVADDAGRETAVPRKNPPTDAVSTSAATRADEAGGGVTSASGIDGKRGDKGRCARFPRAPRRAPREREHRQACSMMTVHACRACSRAGVLGRPRASAPRPPPKSQLPRDVSRHARRQDSAYTHPHLHPKRKMRASVRHHACTVARRVRLRLRDGCEKHHLHKHDVEEVAGRVLVLERCETDVRAVSHAAG